MWSEPLRFEVLGYWTSGGQADQASDTKTSRGSNPRFASHLRRRRQLVALQLVITAEVMILYEVLCKSKFYSVGFHPSSPSP